MPENWKGWQHNLVYLLAALIIIFGAILIARISHG